MKPGVVSWARTTLPHSLSSSASDPHPFSSCSPAVVSISMGHVANVMNLLSLGLLFMF